MISRWTGDVRFRLGGDEKVANSLQGHARAELGILRNLMSFQGLQQDQRTVRSPDGIVINVQIVMGQATANIYVPPIVLPVEKRKAVTPLKQEDLLKVQPEFLWNLVSDFMPYNQKLLVSPGRIKHSNYVAPSRDVELFEAFNPDQIGFIDVTSGTACYVSRKNIENALEDIGFYDEPTATFDGLENDLALSKNAVGRSGETYTVPMNYYMVNRCFFVGLFNKTNSILHEHNYERTITFGTLTSQSTATGKKVAALISSSEEIHVITMVVNSAELTQSFEGSNYYGAETVIGQIDVTYNLESYDNDLNKVREVPILSGAASANARTTVYGYDGSTYYRKYYSKGWYDTGASVVCRSDKANHTTTGFSNIRYAGTDKILTCSTGFVWVVAEQDYDWEWSEDRRPRGGDSASADSYNEFIITLEYVSFTGEKKSLLITTRWAELWPGAGDEEWVYGPGENGQELYQSIWNLHQNQNALSCQYYVNMTTSIFYVINIATSDYDEIIMPHFSETASVFYISFFTPKLLLIVYSEWNGSFYDYWFSLYDCEDKSFMTDNDDNVFWEFDDDLLGTGPYKGFLDNI